MVEMQKQSGLLLVGLGLVGVWPGLGCPQKGDDGFGNTGVSVPPTQDTGPWFVDTQVDTGLDTSDSDPQDTQDTQDPVLDTGFDLAGEGYSRGDVVYNLVANDHNDSQWKLYQQYEGVDPPPWNVTVLVFGAAYEPNFQTISGWLTEVIDTNAALADSVSAEFSVKGAVFLTYDESGVIADVDAASAWAAANDLSNVLYESSPSQPIATAWALYSASKPRIYLIGTDMTVEWVADDGHTTSSRLDGKIRDLVLAR